MVPIITSVSPSIVYVGGQEATLQVNGVGFTSASTVLINGNQRKTTFVNGTSLTAQALASDLATLGQQDLLVTTPAPGGGTSNYAYFTVGYQSPVVKVIPSSSNLATAETLTLSISVSAASGYPTPTGTVSLASTTYSSAAVALTDGSATIGVPAGSLSLGADTLTVTYTPDSAGASFYREASGVTTVSVGTKVTPALSLALSSSSITTTQALTVTATVRGGTGNPTPTGSVTLTSGRYASAATALRNGSATIKIPPGHLTSGSDTLTASYTPDESSSATYAAAHATKVIKVIKATPAIAWPDPEPIVYGTDLSSKQLDATAKVDGESVPGKFAYYPLAGTVLGAGSHDLMVTFTPTNSTDSNKAMASSRLRVNKAKSALSLTLSASSATFGKLVTFSAKATATGHGAVPRGTVTFLSGSTLLGTSTLNSKGVAEYSTTKLSVGKHNITAKYAGNADYAADESDSQSITVNSASGRGTVVQTAGSFPVPQNSDY